MVLGIVFVAMIAGGTSAVAALWSGQSILSALAYYSFSGIACAVVIMTMVVARAYLSAPKTEMKRSDATV